MLYSIIIPVYNRPEEIDELLYSLTLQTCQNFEVLVIEDGSEIDCKSIAESYKDSLDIHYHFKENSGQGFSRNYGFDRAIGDYFIVFDSDCIVPPHYLETVNQYIALNRVDCWGGPDRALPSFTPMQKAINFSMTSFLTTGGIRGKSKRIDNFHPRSFNMGIHREVYRKTGGYRITRMGEDIEFSIRIMKAGFSTALIEKAYVYHKRRVGLMQFYDQLYFFGRARVNISRFYPNELKIVHLFPLLFTAGLILLLPLIIFEPIIAISLIALYFIYSGLILTESYFKTGSLYVAMLSIAASFTQLIAYASGFINETKRDLFSDFDKN